MLFFKQSFQLRFFLSLDIELWREPKPYISLKFATRVSLKAYFLQPIRKLSTFYNVFFLSFSIRKRISIRFNVYFEPDNARSYIISNLENVHYPYRNEIIMPDFTNKVKTGKNIITHTHLLCSSWRPVGEVSNAYALLNELS